LAYRTIRCSLAAGRSGSYRFSGVAPIIGGPLGGAIHRWLRGEQLPTSEAHGRRPLPQA
jgi:hypothetical protein